MNELLTKIKEKFNTIWSRLTKIQKIIISVSLFGFLAFLIVFSTVANKINYEPLFTGLEAKDAAAIKAQLDKMAVPYKITDNGSTIEVDSKNKYAIRLDLAKNGAMPNGGVVGFEIFDTTKIGATDFDKKMMFLRAQKGELERTIGSMSNVKKASRFIFLNRTGYNGLYRVNKQGQNNVPFGRYKNFDAEIVSEEHHALLKRTEITKGDYSDIFDRCSTTDFVFLDPPYDCVFTDYGNIDEFDFLE